MWAYAIRSASSRPSLPVNSASYPRIGRDLALMQLFHTPPSTPQIDSFPVPPQDPRSRARWLGYKRTDLPHAADFEKAIDFHQIVAAMNQYPTLLRRLGLAVDLIVAPGTFSPSANDVLRVDVKLPPGSPTVTRAPDVSQRTRVRLDANGSSLCPGPVRARGTTA